MKPSNQKDFIKIHKLLKNENGHLFNNSMQKKLSKSNLNNSIIKDLKANLTEKENNSKINSPKKKSIYNITFQEKNEYHNKSENNFKERNENHNKSENKEKIQKLKKEKMKNENFEKIMLEKLNLIENECKNVINSKKETEKIIKLINGKSEELKRENKTAFENIIKKYFSEIQNEFDIKIQSIKDIILDKFDIISELFLGSKQKREYNIKKKENMRQKQEYEINNSNIDSDLSEIQIKEEIDFGKMVLNLENSLSTFNSMGEHTYEEQMNYFMNRIENDKKNKNEVQKEKINENILKIYFEKINYSIFYGIPIGSNIKILDNNIVENPNSTNTKQFFIIGNEVLNFNKDFKYEFSLDKINNGISIGLININLAIKYNFKFMAVHNKCSILISSSIRIYNYFDNNKTNCILSKKKSKDIKYIILEFDYENNDLKFTCLRSFNHNINFTIKLDMEKIKNEEFRIGVFFRGINSKLCVKKA